jgi:amino acid adenylation domain-containing protein
VTLPPHLVAQIDGVVRQFHTSPAVFFLACWILLLWRHLGQADTLVGMACDGRNYEPLQDALGLFARYVPIRCALEAQESFSGLLEQLNVITQEADHRQEYFAWDNTGNQSDTGPAFFPLCFEFVEHPAASVSAGISFVIEQLDACTERFKVKLACVYQGGALTAALHYDAQAFQSETIASLAEQLQTLLASASQHPEARVDQLEILSDSERQRVLVTFNQTQVAEPHNLCLHHLFEAQAARTPDRIAVVCADHYLSYAALNARANQLAHHLRQLGVAPQMRVGICLEGSLEMLVGILGILKAGGAYVPLDPTYPRERLAFMATDVQAPVVLTQARLLEGVTEYGPQAVCLDTGWEAIARHSGTNPVSEVTCGHLAYVIYTSGSTGHPKGVLVTHGNVVHSTRARLAYYRKPVAAFLLLSSFAFDSSVAGLFGTLCQGGTLILPGTGYQADLGHLTTLITHHQVSHLLSLPSLYALLLQQASLSQLDSLRAVMVAGEACSPGLVTQHYERLPDAAMFNEYGPTEGTVWSSVYACQLQDVATSVPIGRPIANTQIYLLNTQLQPVPSGIAGELYIGGAGVTDGYCNRAALTAERFLPHPFSDAPGVRLYKTGDLGRHRPDGTIEFLGRTDQQVKIRGFRIELGEIEAVLQEHAAIREAVVIATSPQHLAAYLVTTHQPPPSSNELRHFLQVKLPDYMVPSFFVWLEALPLAPNGKVDRQALSEAKTLYTELDTSYVAPATEVERTLAIIWQEVLQVEKVGMHDNFFDLGGHSLAMVHVHSKLQALYSRDLSLVDLFRYPTISALASYVSQQEHEPFTAGQSDARAQMRRDSIRRQRQLRQERRNAAQQRAQHE